MAKTAWPTTAELTSRLTGLGITLPTGMVLQDELDAAVEMLERVSGQKPFLLESAAADYKIDPSRRTFVDLRSRWPSITSVTLDGAALVAGTDYWPNPFGGPYTWLEVPDAAMLTGEPQTLVVNGKRGWDTTIPLTVWKAVLDYAAGSIHKTASAAGSVASGPLTEIKQDSVTLKYASGSSGASAGSTGDTLMSNALEVFESYRRVAFGGV